MFLWNSRALLHTRACFFWDHNLKHKKLSNRIFEGAALRNLHSANGGVVETRCSRLRSKFELPESARHWLCKPGGVKILPIRAGMGNLSPFWFSGNVFTRRLRGSLGWLSERLAEYGWKPHRILLGSIKPIMGLNVLIYA